MREEGYTSTKPHFAKSESESDVTYSQVWWPILGIPALHLYPSKVHTHSSEHTHTVNTHPEQCLLNSWVRKPLKCTRLSVYVRDSFRISTLFSSVQLTAFAVLLLAVIKQCCIAAGAPFWIGGELPVFVVRPHAPNREVRTVTVRYEYMYRATPNIHI